MEWPEAPPTQPARLSFVCHCFLHPSVSVHLQSSRSCTPIPAAPPRHQPSFTCLSHASNDTCHWCTGPSFHAHVHAFSIRWATCYALFWVLHIQNEAEMESQVSGQVSCEDSSDTATGRAITAAPRCLAKAAARAKSEPRHSTDIQDADKAHPHGSPCTLHGVCTLPLPSHTHTEGVHVHTCPLPQRMSYSSNSELHPQPSELLPVHHTRPCCPLICPSCLRPRPVWLHRWPVLPIPAAPPAVPATMFLTHTCSLPAQRSGVCQG